MKIGDRVTSKKTGLPMTGTIVGILKGVFYRALAKVQDSSPWYDLYPEWLDSEVYYVNFDTPQKSCSFEEFVQQSELSIEDAQVMYKYTVPFAHNAAYPKDDLELIDELVITN